MIVDKDNLVMRFVGKEMKHVFFVADTHFCHQNIIRLCNRPFESIEQQDETLIENWNKKVPENAIVFHLGDVGMKMEEDKIKKILDSLHGKIYLIVGNHDIGNIDMIKYRFEGIFWQLQLQMGKTTVWLNHNPFLAYAGTYKEKHPAYQLFGHVHTGLHNYLGLDIPRMKHLFLWQYDVGVDNNHFTPISWMEIQELMLKRKEWKIKNSKEADYDVITN